MRLPTKSKLGFMTRSALGVRGQATENNQCGASFPGHKWIWQQDPSVTAMVTIDGTIDHTFTQTISGNSFVSDFPASIDGFVANLSPREEDDDPNIAPCNRVFSDEGPFNNASYEGSSVFRGEAEASFVGSTQIFSRDDGPRPGVPGTTPSVVRGGLSLTFSNGQFTNISGLCRIELLITDDESGTLFLLVSPDGQQRDTLETSIRYRLDGVGPSQIYWQNETDSFQNGTSQVDVVTGVTFGVMGDAQSGGTVTIDWNYSVIETFSNGDSQTTESQGVVTWDLPTELFSVNPFFDEQPL